MNKRERRIRRNAAFELFTKMPEHLDPEEFSKWFSKMIRGMRLKLKK